MRQVVPGVVWNKYRLREYMDRAGFRTLISLADHVGISRQTITDGINGNTEPTLSLTFAIAKAIGVQMESFVELAPDGRSMPNVNTSRRPAGKSPSKASSKPAGKSAPAGAAVQVSMRV